MRDKQKMAEVAARLRIVVDYNVNVARRFKTQEAWAQNYGVKKNVLTNWLRGSSYPDIEVMMSVCHDEQLSLDWIYRGVPAGVSASWAEYLRQPKPALQAASQVKDRLAPEKI